MRVNIGDPRKLTTWPRRTPLATSEMFDVMLLPLNNDGTLEKHSFNLPISSTSNHLNTLAHKFGDVFLGCHGLLFFAKREFGEDFFEVLVSELPIER